MKWPAFEVVAKLPYRPIVNLLFAAESDTNKKYNFLLVAGSRQLQASL